MIIMLLKLGLVASVSWLLGLAAYLLSHYILYGEVVGRSNDEIMNLVAVICYPLVLMIVFYPAMMTCVQKRLLAGSTKPAWAFPLAASTLFIMPTVILLIISGDWDLVGALSSSETIPLYCMFIIIGIPFGLGHVWVERTTPWLKPPAQKPKPLLHIIGVKSPSDKTLPAHDPEIEALLTALAESRRVTLRAPADSERKDGG